MNRCTTIDRTDPTGGSDSTTVALVLVMTGTVTDGSHAVTLQDSDDGTSWGTAAAEYVQGTSPTITSANSNAVYELGYMGPKRYLRVSVTGTGATVGAVYGAVILLGGAGRNPVQR